MGIESTRRQTDSQTDRLVDKMSYSQTKIKVNSQTRKVNSQTRKKQLVDTQKVNSQTKYIVATGPIYKFCLRLDFFRQKVKEQHLVLFRFTSLAFRKKTFMCDLVFFRLESQKQY